MEKYDVRYDKKNLSEAKQAWSLMLQTPRHYKNEETFTDWSGIKSVPCPLSAEKNIAE